MTFSTHVVIPDALAPRAQRETAGGGAFRYRLFGGVLESDLVFPELALDETNDAPRWRFTVSASVPPQHETTTLGARTTGIEEYELSRTTTGHRLRYSHGGIFDIDGDGARITWYRRDGAALELVRNIVIGPALALALEAGGELCLHGSAVVIDGRAIAFVGPKHHGKSTIAAALTRAGARLVGDDLIAIAPGAYGTPAHVRPGVASLRLWSDAASAIDVGGIGRAISDGMKTTATDLRDAAVARTAAPLAALYLLQPVTVTSGGAAVLRAPVRAAEATIALAQQMKLPGSLVGVRGAAARLGAVAVVAANVPVFRLAVVRDFGRLPAVVSELLNWHHDP